MKKFLLLLFILLNMITYSEEISKISENNLIAAFKNKGFKVKIDEDYIFLKKKYYTASQTSICEQRVDIFIHNHRVFSIDLISRNIRNSVTEETLRNNLKDMVKILKKEIVSKSFKTNIEKAFENVDSENFGLIESEEGIIRTTSLSNAEKSLNISID